MRRSVSNTCLAVIKDNDGKLVFAGDRRLSFGDNLYQKGPRSKIAKKNGVLLAGSGLSFLCELIVGLFDPPDIADDQEPYDYMFNDFLDSLIQFLRVKTVMHKEELRISVPEMLIKDEDEDDHSVSVLVGVGGELFELTMGMKHFALDCVSTPFATGCGGCYALGSLLTTEGNKMSAEKRLTVALNVAARCSQGCDNNIDILKED